VATKIKLMRLGKMREPHYRIVVADARTKRDGRAIEAIGEYHPKSNPSIIKVDSERAQYWLGVGAQPTEAVAAILRVTGDWQRFRGEPAPEPMRATAPKADKRALFAEAAREAAAEPKGEATTPRKRASRAKAADAGDGAQQAAPKQTASERAASEQAPPEQGPSEQRPSEQGPSEQGPATAPAES
jgi:small subunit ribosomal protein S16